MAVEVVEPAGKVHHESRQIASVNALGATWRLVLTEAEVLERPCDRAYLQHLARHPDPLATAYDVATPVCWGSTDLVLDDPPHSHAHDWRLHRTNGFRLAHGGGRLPLKLPGLAVVREPATENQAPLAARH